MIYLTIMTVVELATEICLDAFDYQLLKCTDSATYFF